MAAISCTQLGLIALASVLVMGQFVKAAETSTCSTPTLGSCAIINCSRVCSYEVHGSVGICDKNDNTCSCQFPCSNNNSHKKTKTTLPTLLTSAPGPINTNANKTCKAAVGKCDAKCNLSCCDAKCKSDVWKTATGRCDLNPRGPFFVCNCDYPC